jgi:hypothetical protein
LRSFVASGPKHAPDTNFAVLEVKFLSTAEPFARSERQPDGAIAETTPRTHESREIRFAIRWLRSRLAGRWRKAGCHCGEEGNPRKFPLASKGGNAIFATIVFQPIRVWGVGSGCVES